MPWGLGVPLSWKGPRRPKLGWWWWYLRGLLVISEEMPIGHLSRTEMREWCVSHSAISETG